MRAPVKPRVSTPECGEVLPLEQVIQALLGSGARGFVYLLGSAGSGKTVALQHLAAVLPADAPVFLWDEGEAIDPSGAEADCLVVRAASSCPGSQAPVYTLVRWGDDDLIEYLLAIHHERCGEVMSRLRHADRELLGGVPELWRVVLDVLANDPTIPHVRGALIRYLETQLTDPDDVERAGNTCLAALVSGRVHPQALVESLSRSGFAPAAARVLRHAEVQLLLAAGRVAGDVRGRKRLNYLAQRLPRVLVRAAAAELSGDAEAMQCLRDLLAGPSWSHAMAASLLHAADPSWMPEPRRAWELAGAYLERAAWAGVQLPQANLRDADLGHANLLRANLDGVDVVQANLRHARLARASVSGFKAMKADLSGADLTAARGNGACWMAANLEGACLQGAVLTGAWFRRARLSGANFSEAKLVRTIFGEAELKDADFSGAGLTGACLAGLCLRDAIFTAACFCGADLTGCDLEGMELPGVTFENANLEGALLTGAVLSAANFVGASLRETGLGDVNMERACLRDADLRGATFHMGSSRSGLLFTPIASEGTRTGFYTDDADEQTFKAPEEIRKANLRGALIDGVDFYLVDLRGARYDAEQEQHLRRCRAILEGGAEGTA